MARPIDPSDAAGCQKAAFGYLARRDYCAGELRSKLMRQGYRAETATAVIAALESKGTLNDRRYIEHFVTRQAAQGKGPEQIAVKLRAFGLNLELVGQIVEEGQDWVERAKRVRCQKFGAALPAAREEILRQSRFLRYRGFTNAQVRAALESEVEIDGEA